MSQPWDASEELWRYREAAAVLASFDYEELRAHGAVSPSSNAKVELLADCDTRYAAEGKPLWSLRTPIRQAALRRLFAQGKVSEALAANPKRPDSSSQRLLEQLLSGSTRPISLADIREEGTDLLEVVSWLDGLPEFKKQLPSTDWIKQNLAREQLLQPFRNLVGAGFAGRRAELSELSDYVGVYDAASLSEEFRRGVEWVRNLHERPPLFIHGPGGCGKSSLICKFILNHAELVESDRFPFAYLDFDRRGLVAEEPITLLLEIMRQLAIQFPDAGTQYRKLMDEWSNRFSQQAAELAKSTALREIKQLRFKERGPFLQEFAEFVNELKTSEQMLLLVLDTFEEVQFRSAAYVEEVLDFLNDLQSRVPRIRTVICGRARLRSDRYKVRIVELGDFDEAAAVAVLAGMGISDPQLAKNIFQQVGGSPLMLRLAADVAKLEKAPQKGIEGMASGWLSIFWEKSKEVVLYKRILSHIVDQRVAKLAYPGLILRVITPGVLLEALAPACNVEVASLDDARSLVRTMHDQLNTILIPYSEDGDTLVHRADMRSVLLRDVSEKAQKDPDVADKMENIHKYAVQFYSRFEDPASRAEEIYHRLALGLDRSALASRWQGGLSPYLGSSIRELPVESQIYLAARLSLELPPELWSKAADEDWILYAERFVAQTLELEKPEAALRLLSERRGLWSRPDLQPLVLKVANAIFTGYGKLYEQIRATQDAGDARTRRMTQLVAEVRKAYDQFPLDADCERHLFWEGGAGNRVVALAIAQQRRHPEDMDLATEAIANALSPFEQFHALLLARVVFDQSTSAQRAALRAALLSPRGTPIHESDPSRVTIRDELLRRLAHSTNTAD